MSTTEIPEATDQSASADRSDRSCPVQRTGPTGQTGHPDRSDRSNTELTGQTGHPGRSDRSNTEWLQLRLDQYRARTNDMCEAIEDSDYLDKLG